MAEGQIARYVLFFVVVEFGVIYTMLELVFYIVSEHISVVKIAMCFDIIQFISCNFVLNPF
jgi:hypothetical protein